jgi:hypothetical protein
MRRRPRLRQASPPVDGEKVADAIDGPHPRREVVDGRRQRADRDIGKLPEAERRILHERAFAANEEEPGDITLAQVPAVHQRDGVPCARHSPTPTVSWQCAPRCRPPSGTLPPPSRRR